MRLHAAVQSRYRDLGRTEADSSSEAIDVTVQVAFAGSATGVLQNSGSAVLQSGPWENCSHGGASDFVDFPAGTEVRHEKLFDLVVAGRFERFGIPVKACSGAECCIRKQDRFGQWPGVLDEITGGSWSALAGLNPLFVEAR